MRTIRIGAAAGCADDRIEPSAKLAEHGGLDYLVFECRAGRTIAAAPQARRVDPDGGHNEWLADRMAAVPFARRRGTRIVTNRGAANPVAAAHVLTRKGMVGPRRSWWRADSCALHLTPERVRQHFTAIIRADVVRYELPQLYALKFVFHHALGGGMTSTLDLDAHG